MPSTIKRGELIRRFRALGFSGPFSVGRHQFMIKGQKKIRIPNPHKSGDIHQAGIASEEWDNA